MSRETETPDWRQNIIDDDQRIRAILEAAHRIAVIGIKDNPSAPAYYVPNYIRQQGYEIIPVNPDLERVFDTDVYDRIGEVPGEIDIVQLFRRPQFIRGHAAEVLAMPNRPKVFWTQSGIVDEGAAELLARAGVTVVMDRCMMVDHRSLVSRY